VRGLLKQELLLVGWAKRQKKDCSLMMLVERVVNKNKLLIFSCWDGRMSCSLAGLDLHHLSLLALDE